MSSHQTPNYYICASSELTDGFVSISLNDMYNNSINDPLLTFDDNTSKFANQPVYINEVYMNVPLFEVVTTKGRTIRLSINQSIMCVDSDISEHEYNVRYRPLSIVCGLDESCSVLIHDHDSSYSIEGVHHVSQVGSSNAFMVESTNGNGFVANGFVVLNY